MAVVALVATVLLSPGVSSAATAVDLGTAESFAVIGSSTVTNTGPSVVNGALDAQPIRQPRRSCCRPASGTSGSSCGAP